MCVCLTIKIAIISVKLCRNVILSFTLQEKIEYHLFVSVFFIQYLQLIPKNDTSAVDDHKSTSYWLLVEKD